MVTAAASPGVPRLRSGPADWLRSYAVLCRWTFASLRLFIPLLVAIEILTGVGFILGFGLFFHGQIPSRSVLYISTGVPIITLYVVGMIFLPQLVSQERIAHTYDYVQSMSSPRSARFAAWYSMNLLAGVPGMIASLVAASLRYGVALHVTLAVVPATLLICLASTALGFALGHAVPMPMVTNVITQVLNFFVIGFSPVCFPPSQLPGWLVSLNHGLPYESMATVMRAAIGGMPVSGLAGAYALLCAWTAASLLVATAAVMRRG